MTLETRAATILSTLPFPLLAAELSHRAQTLGEALPEVSDPSAKLVLRDLANAADDAAGALRAGSLGAILADPFMAEAVVAAGKRLAQGAL